MRYGPRRNRPSRVLRIKHREQLHQGRAPDEHHDLLGHADHHVLDAYILRDAAPSPRGTCWRADGLCTIPRGIEPASKVGRKILQCHALDRYALRRTLPCP